MAGAPWRRVFDRAVTKVYLPMRSDSSESACLIDSYLRHVNARLAFVARVVADPQLLSVPHEAGIAGVAAAGQLQNRLERLAAYIEPGDFGFMAIVAQHPAGGDPSSVGNLDEV